MATERDHLCLDCWGVCGERCPCTCHQVITAEEALRRGWSWGQYRWALTHPEAVSR